MPVSNDTVAAARDADGRLQVFVVGQTSGTVYSFSQSDENDASKFYPGVWMGYYQKGVRASQIAVGANRDGRLELLALRDDGGCYHQWQMPSGSWSEMRDLGANKWKQIELISNRDHDLELFALAGGNVYHSWQTSPGGDWSAAAPFGTNGVDQIAVAKNDDGRLEVFARTAGDVWHFWQTSDGGWSKSERFGTNGVDQIAVAKNDDGRLEVFARTAGDVWHFWQTSPGGNWSPSERFGTSGVDQIAVANDGGRLEVFARTGGDVWHFWQKSPGGDWNPSGRFETVGVGQMAVANNADGNLRQLLVVAGHQLYRAWKSAEGNWSTWEQLEEPEPPPSCSIDADPKRIAKGESSTLFWSTDRWSLVDIESSSGFGWAGVSELGSMSVSPDASERFTLVVSARGGETRCAVTVEVV